MEYAGHASGWDEVVLRGDPAAREFIAFWLADGRVVAGMNFNVWDVNEQIQALIRSRRRVDPARLADAGIAARGGPRARSPSQSRQQGAQRGADGGVALALVLVGPVPLHAAADLVGRAVVVGDPLDRDPDGDDVLGLLEGDRAAVGGEGVVAGGEDRQRGPRVGAQAGERLAPRGEADEDLARRRRAGSARRGSRAGRRPG